MPRKLLSSFSNADFFPNTFTQQFSSAKENAGYVNQYILLNVQSKWLGYAILSPDDSVSPHAHKHVLPSLLTRGGHVAETFTSSVPSKSQR